MRNAFSILIAVSLSFPVQFASGREVITSTVQAPITPTTSSQTPQTTVITIPQSDTIQTLAEKSKSNNMMGTALAIGVTVFATYQATINCSSPPNPSCPFWVAGAIAGGVATLAMSKAKDQSAGIVPKITVAEDGSVPTTTTLPGSNSPPPVPDYFSSPEWQATQAKLKQFQDQGWKFDPTTKKVISPDGKVYSGSMSSGAMSAAGIPSSQIKGFQDDLKKAVSDAKEKLSQAADKTDMYGDGIGGGGSRSVALSPDGIGNAGGPGGAGQKLGIDRDPAQVAGMAKMYNGEPIGVAADSAFGMIQRRYDLHEQQGSFLLKGK